ncbi:redoxin domain-containing protein [Altererythrobacter sediminis]|uniref:thioredoxin-dependent peroxiredoxin n=2 Tax=Allopontixanthobacter sediminis TaxID=1689985 RepID=A0A845B3G3_9SPHN|nr:redoxin domain-containing protein [Allopontixanthobacter sediminis]
MGDIKPGQTIEAGDTIPDIGLETTDGGTVGISDFAGQKVVLFFYPKDNTPGCTSQAKDFSALKDQFAASNTAVLGISKDSAKKHLNFIAKHGLTVPLATDAENGGLSDALGIWTEKQMYGKTYMGMVRTTVLVDAGGKAAQVWHKVKVKGHAEEVLAAARAL